MKSKPTQKRLIGTTVTVAVATFMFYGGLTALPFIVAMVFVLGMSGMLFFRVFLDHTLYFRLALGVAVGAGLILLIGWGHIAIIKLIL